MSPLLILDHAGVALFAASGALAASRKQLDIIGFLFLAGLTGVGGGTVRDLVLGQAPVFWVRDPSFLGVIVGVTLAVWVGAPLIEYRYRLLLWLDAVGLSAYAAMGAAKGLAATGSASVALVTGVLTACFGGVLRDLLAGETSVLLRPEIYVAAALAGATAHVTASLLGAPVWLAAAVGFTVAFGIRGGALAFGWALPRYRPRPGRKI